MTEVTKQGIVETSGGWIWRGICATATPLNVAKVMSGVWRCDLFSIGEVVAEGVSNLYSEYKKVFTQCQMGNPLDWKMALVGRV